MLEGIKLEIDKQRVNGDFLFTGSANVLDMKKAKETLAGRIIEILMYPLSQKEIAGKPDDNIIDILFTEGVEGLKLVKKPYTEALEARLKRGLS